MPFEIDIQLLPACAHVTLRGPAVLADFEEALAHLRVRSRLDGWTRSLFDLRQVHGALTFTEQFLLGEMAVKYMDHLDRVASLVPPERITRTSEQVARAQGMQLRIFTDEQAARAWLDEAAG